MEGLLALLVLLGASAAEVSRRPYQADSDGNCVNSTTEYLLDGSNLCCKKCLPGQRLKQECSETTETVCEPCQTGQYMESWNYAQNCFSCPRCKRSRGLQEGQTCSSTTRSRCMCQPGMHCIMGFEDPYCTECSKFQQCRAGYGVSVQGTGNSDVRCERCPNGTFSDTVSSTDRCLPHTNCHGRVVVRKGDATSDTICDPENLISDTSPQTPTEAPRAETAFATARTVTSEVSATTDYEAPRRPTNSTLVFRPSASEAAFNNSTKSPTSRTTSDSMLGTMAAVIAGVIGLILFVTAVLLFLCKKPVWKKDAATFPPKVDANGNCESGDKVDQDYLETQLTLFTETSPEQQCLLQNGDACSDYTTVQYSNNTETLTGTDGCSSQESIGPLRSFGAAHNPRSALSEPMALLSTAEPVMRQSSVPAQSSSQSSFQPLFQPSFQPSSQPSSQSSSQSPSQPTSPQVISPVTTSPHVNVNITFHIGNGSCGTPSVTPTDLMQVDSKLPFGEEESFSIPQQEAGKQSLMSVQESES